MLNAMTLYNSIGRDYNHTRQPDERIVERLIELLNLPVGSIIADIGAGTGNYSNALAERGYRVMAIEPSRVMQSQRRDCPGVSWLTAAAENIPLPDNAVDGAIVMLALHHFNNVDLGIREITRITKNNVVIFAFEPDLVGNFWLSDYFPYFIDDTPAKIPSTSELALKLYQNGDREVEILPFLLPPDLEDRFAASGWCRPEIYLDARVRNGISTFAKMPLEEIADGLKQLSADIESGVWLRRYGHLLQLKNYDAGYRIIFTRSNQ